MSNLLWFPPGIFKIEDSAHVARLWGLRKNRPAMNYDKLSRSIRQYYKKGIIRKPDVSQRLVYQFVHPVWGSSVVGRGGGGDEKRHTISPCTWTPRPEAKRWHGTRALTNPNGTHFHCQHRSNSWQLLHEGLSYREEETKQCGCWGFFSCCRIKQPQVKTRKSIKELPCHLHDLPVYLSIMWSSFPHHAKQNVLL